MNKNVVGTLEVKIMIFSSIHTIELHLDRHLICNVIQHDWIVIDIEPRNECSAKIKIKIKRKTKKLFNLSQE